MFRWLPSPLKGLFAWSCLLLSTVFWCVPLYLFFALKYLLPFKKWREFWADLLHGIGNYWHLTNKLIINITQDVKWDIQGMPSLSNDKWYFIACNHQSWADIMVVTHLFAGKIPFIKYFVKDSLKYFPLIGLAWKAFDFPMMKRYSKKKLAKKPHLRGKDIESTMINCKKYLRKPSTILSFVEGTRFTSKKHSNQKSPFKHLLRPKPGGFALTIKAMQNHIDSFIHVTIIYPENQNTFWQFMCGRIKNIKVIIEEIPIPHQFKNGDYTHDLVFRDNIKDWVYELWAQKDKKIDKSLKKSA